MPTNKKFTHQPITKKQKKVCKTLNLIPPPSFFFSLKKKKKFPTTAIIAAAAPHAGNCRATTPEVWQWLWATPKSI